MTKDKKAVFAAFQSGRDAESRLFFAARNLAIESILLKLELEFLKHGFNTECQWKEYSTGVPYIQIGYKNPKPTATGWLEAAIVLMLNRQQLAGPQYLSTCYYDLRTMARQVDSRRTAKPVQAFWDVASALHEAGYFEALIAKVNYPFDHTSYSVF